MAMATAPGFGRQGWLGMAQYLQCTAVSLSLLRVLIPVAQFVEYDQRAHKLQTLAKFSFWVPSKDPHHPVDLKLIPSRASAPLSPPPISSHRQRLPLTQPTTTKAASQFD